MLTTATNVSVQFCCGEDFTLLLTQTGRLFSVGKGAHGQLGHGDLRERNEPMPVEAFALLTIRAIAAGSHHCLAHCNNDDSVYAWGAGKRGQLGNGQIADRHAPCKIDTRGVETGYVALNCGVDTSGLVTGDGKAYVWGSNSHRQLGRADAADLLLPVQVDLCGTDVEAVQLLLGEGMGLVQTRNHGVFGWGRKLPFMQNDGLPQLVLSEKQFAEHATMSPMVGMALLGRHVYYRTGMNNRLEPAHRAC